MIKIKSLQLNSTTGTLLTATSSSSSADFVASNNGKAISHIYFQDQAGRINGERLGTEHTVFIAVKDVANQTEIKREHKILIGQVEFMVQDIIENFTRNTAGTIIPNSRFEPFYELNLLNANN